MAISPKIEIRNPNQEKSTSPLPSPGSGEGDAVRFLTRHELAEALKVSVRTVDTMLAGGEIPHLRLHGNFVRFYLPDVVRHLTATALVSKRRWAGPVRGEIRSPKPETRIREAEILQKVTEGTKNNG